MNRRTLLQSAVAASGLAVFKPSITLAGLDDTFEFYHTAWWGKVEWIPAPLFIRLNPDHYGQPYVSVVASPTREQAERRLTYQHQDVCPDHELRVQHYVSQRSDFLDVTITDAVVCLAYPLDKEFARKLNTNLHLHSHECRRSACEGLARDGTYVQDYASEFMGKTQVIG